ncbi:hypothetical protein DY218_09985 [Streptomyces triticagri]|uniref:Serine/threonine protein kinase n=2 Tax=Streptomyces triticagri TaxID=2293568 RepID=A0A372M8D9_9ACTN|nr:hypothetical protein DY218_09985 [Streptomyces triticagri]
MGIAAFTVLLPFAVASAGPSARAGTTRAGLPADPVDSRAPTGPGGRTERCGPELASADGVEAQTCVITDRGRAWARTYYRNATGEALRAVLTLLGPGDRTLRTHCRIATGDEPGVCETPRAPVRAADDAGSAVAEFASAQTDGPLLLRSGSNSPDSEGR